MPLFKRNDAGPAQQDEEGFIITVAAWRVVDDTMTPFQLRNRRIILTRHEGVIYAFDAACPHAAADLSRGSLRGWRIWCHDHDYCFDIRNGRLVWPEDEPYRLKRYEVKIEDGMVLVRL